MGSGDMAIAPLVMLGPIGITSTVLTTWLLTAIVGVLAWGLTRHLRMEPGPLQTAVEGIVGLIESAVGEVAGEHTARILPFIGSLWIFLVTANLAGLIPGLHSPTRDLSTTAALAFLVFPPTGSVFVPRVSGHTCATT
jgi:F-type H+-transporting ATPase subunit a